MTTTVISSYPPTFLLPRAKEAKVKTGHEWCRKDPWRAIKFHCTNQPPTQRPPTVALSWHRLEFLTYAQHHHHQGEIFFRQFFSRACESCSHLHCTRLAPAVCQPFASRHRDDCFRFFRNHSGCQDGTPRPSTAKCPKRNQAVGVEERQFNLP